MPPPADGHRPGIGELIAGMRRRGDEAQWTQMIAAVARAAGTGDAGERTFASHLAELLLAAAPNAAAVAMLGSPPHDLLLRAERSYGKYGVVDLVFSDALEQWVLLVELKLHSGYGDRQIDRYLAALETIAAPHRALIAVTKILPVYGEHGAEGHPRWLGSVRWRDIFDELRALPISEPALADGWRASLDLLRNQGDFGLMTFNDDVMAVWNRRAEADRFVGDLLAEIGPRIEVIARKALGERGTVRLLMSGRSRSQPIVRWYDKPHIDYAIPKTAKEPRLRVQFMTGEDRPYFTVEARYQHPQEDLDDDPQVTAAFAKLEAAGFDVNNDGLGHYCARVVPVEEWMGPDATEKLLAVATEAIAALIDSGIFTALDAHVPATPQSATPDEVERMAPPE